MAALSSGSNVSRAAAYAIIVLLVVAGAAFLINSRTGGVQVYVYPTSSMVPTLEVGDLVVVQSTSYSSLHVGQVIVFAEPTDAGTCGSLVIVHRIVEITAQGIITQGDYRFTNPRPDEPLSWPPVPAQCLRGVVAFALPYLGEISQAFPPPLNYILVAIIIIVVFMLELTTGARKEESEKKEEQPRPEGA